MRKTLKIGVVPCFVACAKQGKIVYSKAISKAVENATRRHQPRQSTSRGRSYAQTSTAPSSNISNTPRRSGAPSPASGQPSTKSPGGSSGAPSSKASGHASSGEFSTTLFDSRSDQIAINRAARRKKLQEELEHIDRKVEYIERNLQESSPPEERVAMEWYEHLHNRHRKYHAITGLVPDQKADLNDQKADLNEQVDHWQRTSGRRVGNDAFKRSVTKIISDFNNFEELETRWKEQTLWQSRRIHEERKDLPVSDKYFENFFSKIIKDGKQFEDFVCRKIPEYLLSNGQRTFGKDYTLELNRVFEWWIGQPVSVRQKIVDFDRTWTAEKQNSVIPLYRTYLKIKKELDPSLKTDDLSLKVDAKVWWFNMKPDERRDIRIKLGLNYQS